jgi:hypothetical protein
MKKLLYVLGAVSFVIVAGVATLVHNGGKFDKESKEFVDGAVPAIVTNWDQRQLLDRATPELRGSVTPGRPGILIPRSFSARVTRQLRGGNGRGQSVVPLGQRRPGYRVVRGESQVPKRYRGVPNCIGQA